jgi:hypothetical protein
LLALLLAAHRSGELEALLRDAEEIEELWRSEFPGGLVEA